MNSVTSYFVCPYAQIPISFQRSSLSPGYVQDIEQPGSIQNVINRKRCVTESATGQMVSQELTWDDSKGKLSLDIGYTKIFEF